jgi:two-component system, OmpR family, response regulator
MKPSFHTARWTLRTLSKRQVNRPPRLLIIDDDGKGAEATAASLSSSGYETRFAVGSLAALVVIAAWMPEIALLDINMPDMDGFALARELRGDARTQQIVLLALTANDERAVRENGIASGFDGYCQKGNAPDSLLGLLGQIAA